MAVNEEAMLPEKTRGMYQMEDLLQSEQKILEILKKIMDGMEQELIELIDETMTPERLKMLAERWAGCECRLEEYPEYVRIRLIFRYFINEHSKLQERLLDIIPAHLEVIFAYLVSLAFGWKEKMVLNGIINYFKMQDLKGRQSFNLGLQLKCGENMNFTNTCVIVQKNLWFWNGEKRFNGEGIYNAREYKEEL